MHPGYVKILFRFYSDFLKEETIETIWGNSTIQVIIMDDKTDKVTIRNFFKERGCISEGVSKSFFVMEIPFSVDYKTIKSELNKFMEAEILEYAEPWLSEKHREDIALRRPE